MDKGTMDTGTKLIVMAFISVSILLPRQVDAAQPFLDNAPTLLDLAETKLAPLTEAERKMFKAAAKGEISDCSGPKKDNDPANAADWPKARSIRADCIEWLCRKPQVALVSYEGVLIRGVRIDGELNLKFFNIPFPLIIMECSILSGIDLRHAEIRMLSLYGTHTGRIKADGLKVEGDVLLRKVKAVGGVHLVGATITGQLACRGGEFISSQDTDGIALNVNSLKITRSVFFDQGFRVKGRVDLSNAIIGGQLNCSSGKFIDFNGVALDGDGLTVGANVLLNKGFKAEGEVNLRGAVIEGQLSCTNGKFIHPNGNALSCDSVKVKKSVLLYKGFKADGIVRLVKAEIDGVFQWLAEDSPGKITLYLQSAVIGTLWDNKESWPRKGKLFLNGFKYDEIGDNSPTDSKSRIEWIRRQYDPHIKKDSQFRPQPYEQLASVLRKMGKDADAKKVLITKNKDRAKWGPKLALSEWFWYRVFGPMIGYGHSPWRAFLIGLAIIVFGTFLFRIGFKNDLMVDTKDSENASSVKFQALVYSIDMFVPLVDLYQAKYWLPDPVQQGEWRPFNLSWFKVPVSGSSLRRYLWFHIIAGWILTTLLVVGLTGLIRT